MCWSLYHASTVSRVKDRIVLGTDELMSIWIVTYSDSLVSTGLLISHKAAIGEVYQQTRTPISRINEIIGSINRLVGKANDSSRTGRCRCRSW
jgi:hypothetical protein